MSGSQTPGRDRLAEILRPAPFIDEIGIRLAEAAAGRCVAELDLEPRHEQQDGVVHAGVMATMADHAAGGAAATLAAPGEIVLGAGFSIHFLRPARGDRLRCVATVLKPGRRLSVVEAEVWCAADHGERLVAKALVSIAVVPAEQVRGPA